MLKMWSFIVLIGITLSTTSAINNFQFPSDNPCIIFDASLQISIIGIFKSGPEAKQVSLDKKSVVMNTSLSYCDDGNSSSIDFLLEGGVGLTVQFLKLNQTVKMMPSISFVPGIIFQNSSKDTNQVTLHSTKGKLLPPANVSYTCYTGDTPIVMSNGSSANISYHGIISLTQIRVQAFDIKDGDLSPGESCDVTPITSVAPPIPRTPTPGNPPVQTFSVQNGNTDCIVLQAAIEFIIPYTSKGARLTKNIGVPNNTQVTGMCGGGVATTQSISLMFYNDWLLNVIFSHTLATSPRHMLMDGTTYGIKEISLEYKVDSSLFPDADTTDEKYLAKMVYKTPEFLTPTGASYRCQSSTIVDLSGVSATMTSFQYLAFGNQTTPTFDPKAVTDCPAPTPLPIDDDNDHTGTIVGVVIAVFFVVMVLIGIYMYRRKSKGSYEQVY